MTTYNPNGLDEPKHATAEPASEPGIADRARAHIDRRTEEARDAARAASDKTRETVARGTEEGARFVRENPGVALAGAVGLGVLIGLALGSGRR